MEELVLGMLKLGPAHGYELRARIRRELGPAWRVATSQLYTWLRRLEEEGNVAGEEQGAGWVAIRGRLEMELSELPEDERREFLEEYGLSGLAVERLVREAYRLLSVVTFYTFVGPEVRAWTVPAGTKAPDAGAAIHTDFRDRFVLAEIMRLEDLIHYGSEKALREAGKIVRAGRDHLIQDGDVIRFISG